MEKEQKIIDILGCKKDFLKTDRDAYLQKVRVFLLGQDFLRLGHCIQGKQWHLVMSNSAKIKQQCIDLEITCFDNYLQGIRDAARGRNVNEAQQIMCRITAKRVQLRKLLAEEK